MDFNNTFRRNEPEYVIAINRITALRQTIIKSLYVISYYKDITSVGLTLVDIGTRIGLKSVQARRHTFS